MNFTQKISELSKLSVIIIWKSGQFHSNYQKNASAYGFGLNEKLDYFYIFEKLERNGKKAG